MLFLQELLALHEAKKGCSIKIAIDGKIVQRLGKCEFDSPDAVGATIKRGQSSQLLAMIESHLASKGIDLKSPGAISKQEFKIEFSVESIDDDSIRVGFLASTRKIETDGYIQFNFK